LVLLNNVIHLFSLIHKDQGSVDDCLADSNTHHGVAPVVLICRQVANSVNATVHMDKALTVVRGYIVTANTGTTWSWNRVTFLIILLRTGIQTGKIQRHARGESDTVESAETIVGVDGHDLLSKPKLSFELKQP
jgi:hypothetical protein